MDMFGLHVVADADAEAAYESRARIYYMKITDGETLVRDMVPVRYDSTGALGMYDLVTNTFYTNDGTGTFIAGPVASFMPQNQQ